MSLEVHIEKNLGSFHLRADFTAEQGIMALLGASGCGKSVTLKCIAGIITPDKGKIILDGQTLFDSEKHINLPPQKRRVGYLFQQYALFPNMTVEQNILCGIRTGSKQEKKQQAADSIRRFRLTGLEKKYPVQLSGGQQQRVALARILVSQPRAILLDEPFSALDSFLKWKLELELSDMLADFSGPILWVSHDKGECFRNCPLVCVMEDGKTGCVQSMQALSEHPNTLCEARLMGCKNFFRAEKAENGVFLPDWNLTLTLPVSCNEGIKTVGIPNDALSLGGDLPFTICRSIPDAEGYILLLRPQGATETAPLLRIAAETPASEKTVYLHFNPEKLLCFEENRIE